MRKRRSAGAPGVHDRYEAGVHHLAFGARSRRGVDDRARWLRKRGAEIESEPREHAYTPGYYAVLFDDPDGIKLEILHRPRWRVLVGR